MGGLVAVSAPVLVAAAVSVGVGVLVSGVSYALYENYSDEAYSGANRAYEAYSGFANRSVQALSGAISDTGTALGGFLYDHAPWAFNW